MDSGIIGDIDLQNRLSVLCALTLFETGIQNYVNDQFDIFHQQLQNQMKYMKNQRCLISCSKHKQHLRDWCILCASWRTTILGKHKSRHTMGKNNTNWSYVDSSKWPEDAREVQKCFNPDWCFKGESSSEDVSVLLSSMNNCHHFKQDVKEIRKIRNNVSHKSKVKIKEKIKWCQMLINFLKDPDIWSYNEAKAASNDIVIFKQRNFIEMIETEKSDRLWTVVDDIVEHNCNLFKLQKRWNYLTFFHHVLMLTILTSVLCLHYEYKSNVDITYNNLLEIIRNLRDASTPDRVCDLGLGLNFSTQLQHHQTFEGRHWLFAGIHQRMEESRGVLLVADSGYGKSAAMVNLIQGKNKFTKNNVIHHFCISSEAKFQRADTFILNIVQNLYCKYPSYENILETRGIFLSFSEIQTTCKFDPVYCFDQLIMEPLSTMVVPPEEERLVLLIDGLDECNTIGFGYSVLTLLQLRYDKLPTWIKLLITSKNDSKIINNFGDLDKWHLHREHEYNKRDLMLYNKKHSRLSEDCLEYLKWNIVLFNDIAEKIQNKQGLYIDNFPTSLDRMFEMNFFSVFEKCTSNVFKRTRVFYEIIIASMKPLTIKELFEIITFSEELLNHDNNNESDFRVLVSTLDQVYFSKDIVHLKPFLQDWLSSLTKEHPCEVNKMRGHAAISRFMLSEIAGYKENMSYDFIVELFMHINKSGENEINIALLNPLRNYVEKMICGHDFYGLKYEPCHSVLDTFASVVDSFSLMRQMISFSKSHNRTLAAINALAMGNTNSFIAILKGGSLDFSCLTNVMRLKTFVNYVYDNDGYFLTDDDFTLLHFAIIQKNHRAFRLIAGKEKETLKQKTKNDITAIQLAVMYDELETFKFLDNNSTIGNILLRFAALVKAYTVFNYLLDNGIHDTCVDCKSFQYKPAYEYVYHDLSLSEWQFYVSVFANRNYHLFLTELTCESILNYAIREGDQVIVKGILRVSNETLECRDFHGLTPLASSIVFQREAIYSYLIERGASADFRCKPVNVFERTKQMISLKIYNTLYTNIFSIPLGTEYCPHGRSIAYLSLRWPSCEIMRSIQGINIGSNVLFEIDINFKTPIYFLVCESGSMYESLFGITNPNSCKMFLFLLFLIQKPLIQNQIDFLVDSCSSSDLNIRLDAYHFDNIQSSVICKDPRLHFRMILDLYFKVKVGDIINKDHPFITVLDLYRFERLVYTGISLPELFPVKSQMFKVIEIHHKGTSITNHLNPLFSIIIENKTQGTPVSSSTQN